MAEAPVEVSAPVPQDHRTPSPIKKTRIEDLLALDVITEVTRDLKTVWLRDAAFQYREGLACI